MQQVIERQGIKLITSKDYKTIYCLAGNKKRLHFYL